MNDPKTSAMNGDRNVESNKSIDSEQQSNNATESSGPIDLDHVLVTELGQFGRYQLISLILVSVPMIFSAFMSEFIFSAAAIPHRCRIPECGESATGNYEYSPGWILNAVPPASGSAAGPASCERYVPLGGTGSLTYCPANIFNQAATQECDSLIYERSNSVVYDFDLGCQEWLRTLAGTLSKVGSLFVLPVTGYISDKYGRRVALIISIFNMALFGFVRAFSVNYTMFLAFQMMQTMLGGGMYSTAYVYAAELTGPKYRVITGAVCGSMFAIGQMLLGSVAWLVQSWRYLIMALHIPCFILVVYYWILPEGVRWLLATQKYDEARKILEKVAKVNKTTISEKSMQNLVIPPPPVTDKSGKDIGMIRTIFNSRVLLQRVLTTPVWWITTTFVYYGLSINSTGLPGNMYANYILVTAIEIPANFFALLILDRVGRKVTLSGGFFLSAICNITFAFIDTNELATLGLVLYLVGKFGISVGFMALYLFTSELYPTQFRHTLLAFSSMIGRIGSITAPLTPALMVYWEGIPSVLFGGLGLLAGALVLTQPETLGQPLPNTLVEAEAIGRAPKTEPRT
ncbi:LOW QUALITY PROTEIN: organic cation transporter protein-like [Choristoneura fumiferana]|uniref:LOW QUALITY PROTEIN: organic cation transporter protein-like n=1 Tax=Choristoneura fumiferana TaxID=7141 RepID=UPI003D15E847